MFETVTMRLCPESNNGHRANNRCKLKKQLNAGTNKQIADKTKKTMTAMTANRKERTHAQTRKHARIHTQTPSATDSMPCVGDDEHRRVRACTNQSTNAGEYENVLYE